MTGPGSWLQSALINKEERVQLQVGQLTMVDLRALADEAGDAVNVDTPAPQLPVNHVEGNQPMEKETSAMDATANESQANAHLALSTPDKVTLVTFFLLGLYEKDNQALCWCCQQTRRLTVARTWDKSWSVITTHTCCHLSPAALHLWICHADGDNHHGIADHYPGCKKFCRHLCLMGPRGFA